MNQFIKRIFPYIAAEVLLDLIATALLSTGPYFQKLLFDYGFGSGFRRVLSICGLFLLVQMANSIAVYFCMKASWKSAIRFEQEMKAAFFHSLFMKRKKEFYSHDIGDYLAIQSSDITALEQDYLQPWVDVIRSANMFIVYGIILFWGIDWRIGTCLLAVSLLAVAGPQLTGRITSKKRHAYQEMVGLYTTKVKDWLEGFSVFNTRSIRNLEAVHTKLLEKVSQKRYSYGKAKTLSLTIDEGAVKCIRVATFVTVGLLYSAGDITVGTAVAAFGYVDCFLNPLNSLLYDVSTIQSVKSVKERFLTFLKEREPISTDTPAALKQGIQFRNLSFERKDFRLQEVSLDIEKGKKVAVIGHSGCGKSTLLRLLLGYDDVENGMIRIDGKELAALDTSYLIAYMAQDEHVFQADQEANITVYGSYCLPLVREAVKRLESPLIERLLNIKEIDCRNFSGGEKEMLTFLRLVAQDCEVIVLDEPFAAVDQKTRVKLEDYLLRSPDMRQKTVVMVTHDISEQLDQFDRVILMDAGKIAAQGTYSEITATEAFSHFARAGK